ncbi:signal peptidase I [Bacillus thuringiensis]|uniref:signal peptidase I n=1 Tax=Bacillus thuringiensis TaxID=1428 RepID=UPI003D0530A9
MKMFRKWLGILLITLLCTGLFNVFILQTYRVKGHSMDPTLRNQEFLFVSKLLHTFSKEPNYGDIVIIDSELGENETFTNQMRQIGLLTRFTENASKNIYVKRVIGKAGDYIEIKDGFVYRNHKKIKEPYIKEPMNTGIDSTWLVPRHHIFVMGDNRNNSKDSREIGPIPLDHLLGKVLI